MKIYIQSKKFMKIQKHKTINQYSMQRSIQVQSEVKINIVRAVLLLNSVYCEAEFQLAYIYRDFLKE